MNDYADIFGLLCVIESMSSSVTPPSDKVRPSPLALNMMKQLRRVGTHNTKEKPICCLVQFGRTNYTGHPFDYKNTPTIIWGTCLPL